MAIAPVLVTLNQLAKIGAGQLGHRTVLLALTGDDRSRREQCDESDATHAAEVIFVVTWRTPSLPAPPVRTGLPEQYSAPILWADLTPELLPRRAQRPRPSSDPIHRTRTLNPTPESTHLIRFI